MAELKLKSTPIVGCYEIHHVINEDDRGRFHRLFDMRAFEEYGLNADIVNINLSINPFAGTLRGFHSQLGVDAEAKTLSCVQGEVYNVVVDLRTDSETYAQFYGVKISASSKVAVHCPEGCANAFLTLEDNSIVVYGSSNFWVAESEVCLRYDDPMLKNIPWPLSISKISEKDKSHPDFAW